MPAAMASHVSNAGAVKREPMTALDDGRGAGRAAPHLDEPREGVVQRPAPMRFASASAGTHRAERSRAQHDYDGDPEPEHGSTISAGPGGAMGPRHATLLVSPSLS